MTCECFAALGPGFRGLPSGHLLLVVGEAERAVVVGQVPDQFVVRVGRGRRPLELFAKFASSSHVDRIGDRLSSCPDPVMGSDEPAVVADLDAGQVGVDVDEPADDVRVDG